MRVWICMAKRDSSLDARLRRKACWAWQCYGWMIALLQASRQGNKMHQWVCFILFLLPRLCVGHIPPEIGLLQKLTSLELFENKLEGRDFHIVPAPFRRWWTGPPALFCLDLGTGTIPPQIGQLFHLEDLNLWRNRLAGSRMSCVLFSNGIVGDMSSVK